MVNHLYIGKGPYQEKLSVEPIQAKRERFAFIMQLKRLAGNPPIGASLQILPEESIPVVCFYENSAAKQYALLLESVIPATWDEEAKTSLL